MKLSTSLYDLKRGVLRLPVILILAIFVMIGIGGTYQLGSQFLTDPTLVKIESIMFVAYDPAQGNLQIKGIVYTIPFKELSGTMIYEFYAWNTSLHKDLAYGRISRDEFIHEVEKTKIKLVGGFITFEGVIDTAVSVDRSIPENYFYGFRYQVITPFGTLSQDSIGETIFYYVNTENNRSVILLLLTTQPRAFGDIQPVPNATISSMMLRLPRPGASTMGVVVIKDPVLVGEELVINGGVFAPSLKEESFEIYIRPSNTPIENLDISAPEKYGYVRVGTVKEGFFSVRLRYKEQGFSIRDTYELLVVARSSAGDYCALLDVPPIVFLIQSPRDPLQVSIVMTLQNVLEPFYMFLPILSLYLAYIFIAKPRSQGALEFLLARPITRRDIYFTRYVAGALVITLSTFMLFMAMVCSIGIMFGVWLDPYPSILLYAGLLVSLLAFYSLCYFISAVTSGGRYLALAIIIYLFFNIIIEIVTSIMAFTSVQGQGFDVDPFREYIILRYRMSYFNPLGVARFASYFSLKLYDAPVFVVGPDATDPLVGVVVPWAVILSSILWVLAPLVLGWLAFRRANLSR